MQFKVGDIVICLCDYDGNNTKEKIGKIIEYGYSSSKIEFNDKNILNKHWYVPNSFLNIYVDNSLEKLLEKKFKTRKVKIVKNGCVYRLVKTNGDTVIIYMQNNDKQIFTEKQTKKDIEYIEMFNETIQEYKEKCKGGQ